MKRLLLDIETSPNTAFVWGLFKQNVAIDQLVDSGRTLCWAAKWYGEKEIFFDSIHQSKPKAMAKRIHALLEEADAVIHFNGAKFDIPMLNREFMLFGLLPPLGYANIDLYQVVKRAFRFPSNKLDYILRALGIGEKVKHKGMQLWVDCMAGDEDAWEKMQEYNIGDIVPLESLYDRLLPWIKTHPNFALYNPQDAITCTNCGGSHVIKKGYAFTKTQMYQRYRCKVSYTEKFPTFLSSNSFSNPFLPQVFICNLHIF